MAEAIKRRRGTTTEHASFVGLDGEVTIDTAKKTAVVHDGTKAGGYPLAREDLAEKSPVFASKSSNYAPTVIDRNAKHRFSANATITLPSAAVLGNTWSYTVIADGGTVVLTPLAGQTINGKSTQTVYRGSDLTIYCDGSNFFSLPEFPKSLWRVEASAVAQIDIPLPEGFDSYRLQVSDLVPSADGVNIRAIFSTDGGATFITAASSYREARAVVDTGPAWVITNNGNSANLLFATSVSNAWGVSLRADISPGSAVGHGNLQSIGVHQSQSIGQRQFLLGGGLLATGKITHIRVYPDSGTLSGKLKLIGF